MSKKPKPRLLSAEPLEERLPVSSSAAGVLFGYGLTPNEPGVERSATPGYEVAQTSFIKSAAQQPALVDLTLDVQLDALAVDLFHAEESLPDTISAPLEDPFVLTPLTPGAALSDTITDAHRKLGDELLLFQISTLDFTQVSFEPMTPERFDPVTPQMKASDLTFEDALTPPDDLTVYGYSPVAKDLEKNDGNGGPQMSCCCGPGSCCCAPTIMSASVTKCGAGCSGSAVANYNCSTGQHYYSPVNVPYPATTFVFQTGDTAAVITNMTWMGGGTGSITVTPNAAPGGGAYWSPTVVTGSGGSLGHMWTWTKPAGLQNNDPSIQRDFTFTYTVTSSSGNAVPVSLFVHVTYVEVVTQFAGEGGFKSINVKGDKTDQTAANTVVIGQHVEAELVYDPAFVPAYPSSFSWLQPSGGEIVKNYTANDTIGKVTKLDYLNENGNYIAHYTKPEFDYYYTSKSANVGSLSCGPFTLMDPNGVLHSGLYAGAKFYIEKPTVDSYTSVFADWGPNSGESSVGVRPFGPSRPISLILGGTPDGKAGKAGITWTANVGAPPVIGGGDIAYNQQVHTDDLRRFNNNVPKQKTEAMDVEDMMLDGSFPYGMKSPTIVSVGTTLVSRDSPSVPLVHSSKNGQLYDMYKRSDSFETYLIYKPVGTSTIWVTLSVIKWGWNGTAVYDTTVTPSKWKLDTGTTTGGGNGTPSSYLPEWDDRIQNHSAWINI